MSTRYSVLFVGDIWQPGVGKCALERDFWAEDDADALRRAPLFESGDFSYVDDFMITTGSCRHDFRIVRNWDREESGDLFREIVYGEAV